jgi:hypothetical protein
MGVILQRYLFQNKKIHPAIIRNLEVIELPRLEFAKENVAFKKSSP